ncbi:hypothetical protein IDH44_07025 [Paenibacillus sp. IB182496]|uniref:Uncharacterized protein n=1 Tax=Paenibacillus sabuli TaxID=2772509 RepID=A0A927GR49_9BACL|nr:hypothetical protein [Paenibacillus sabuli]MBD2844936.1 hypothetical protein [Paenibacillus sabuli]
MRWFTDYEEEIKMALELAREAVKAYPSSLRETAETMLRRADPRHNRSNYVAYLLPLWLAKDERHAAAAIRLAGAHFLAALHFGLVDDMMDEPPAVWSGERRQLLLLSQLLQESFKAEYRRHFSSDSVVWEDLGRYTSEWAVAALNERARIADPRNVRQLAAKAAPVKLGASALLELRGEPEQRTAAERAVELTLATLQLADDWADWQDDLTQPEGNAFLSLVREHLPLQDQEAPWDARLVKRAVYHYGALDGLSRIADDLCARLSPLTGVSPMLIAYQRSICDGIRRDARAARAESDRLVLGGFHYHLHNFLKK